MSRVNNVAEQRATIIAATIRVLTRDGLAETTTRKIAAEANVNQATLRYYFGSKDDLLFAVLQEMIRMTQRIVQANLPTNADLHTAITEGIQAFWTSVEEAPELQIIQYELTLYALRHPQSAWLARQQYEGYSSAIESLFRGYLEASGKTSAVPPSEVARFVISGIDGLILQFISDPNTARSRKNLRHLIAATISLVEGRSFPDEEIPVSR
ncbi:MAG: TetR/AcrR family transcriptional regulator [Ktedonobacteraceae bacterium]|nr:TetR/AcrR family transcriptional regulator [Ktedonobacteraceae bacterium]MBV9615197.1 TetR/AcrR family transcriptional regulator [Ktedonobacteraceae bacterium]